MLSLNLSELNFSKKQWGKKKENLNSFLPGKFTRRDRASRAAEVFDLLGRFTPITTGIKLDLSDLSLRGLDWDDQIPNNLISQKQYCGLSTKKGNKLSDVLDNGVWVNGHNVS